MADPEETNPLNLSPDVWAALQDINETLRGIYAEDIAYLTQTQHDALALVQKVQSQLSHADAKLLDPVVDLLTPRQ